MKLLEDIPTFPAAVRKTLESGYGIDSAESFYSHALANPAGLAAALNTNAAEVQRLIRLVEGYLPAGYRERSLKPVHHPRGLIVDP